MKRGAVLSLLLASLMILFLTTCTVHPARADLGTDIDSGWASTVPTLDGHISSGEWADATVQNFTLQMRDSTNSANRTLQGTLYVKNNLTYAFLAIQIFNDDYESHDFGGHYKGLAVLFSDNDSGTLVVGDNGEGVTTWTGSPFYSNNDLYYTGSYWDSDVDAGKANNGSLAWSHTGAPTQGAIGNWTFEMAIPLVGSDGLAYDFNITSLPYTVGYKIWFQDPTPIGLSGVYPDNTTIAPITQTTNAATFGDITFYPLYNLTMVAGMGGTTSPSPGLHQYPYNTVVNATATVDPWYEFDHWELDGINVGVANPYSVTMNQNHTLEALFHPLYALNITSTAGGTTNPVPGTYVYPNGTVVSVSAIPASWYYLDHWELDSVNVGTVNPYSVTMDQNHTLRAVFLPLYALNISTTTGGTTNPAPGTYVYHSGTVVSVSAIPSSWYYLDHWELDTVNVGSANPYSVTMSQNHTLRAVFLPLYALNITATAGGTTNPALGTHVYAAGTSVSVSAIPSSGYDFDHWELDTVNVGTGNPYSVLMNQNHTLNAVFVAQLSVVISPTDVTLTIGSSVTFNSVVTGGTPAYSYQWYMNSGKVTGANAASWTFTPPAIGTYLVYLNVTDFRGRVAVSNTARVIVIAIPVGGYSVSLAKGPSNSPVALYVSILAAFGVAMSMFKRRKTSFHKSFVQ